MPLSGLNIRYDYRSDRNNLVDEFYIPCFGESTEYWRAVGYFTSSALALAAKGLAPFIKSGGRMKLVASPILNLDDAEAIEKGYELRAEVLERTLLSQLADDKLALQSDIERRRLECLAWLISEGRLDIKLALPTKRLAGYDQAIYHEKIGVFFDLDNNAVAFSGSPNETYGGLVSNFESIEVHKSWDDPHGRVKRKIEDFERLWSNQTTSLKVLDFPDAAKQRLLQIRTSSAPTQDPESVAGISKPAPELSGTPDVPSELILRPYQIEACDSWFANECHGMFAMATGSGKAITSLAAAVRLLKERARLFVVVACPFKHLVDQWKSDAEKFGFRPIVAYDTRTSWEGRVNERIIDYNLSVSDHELVITTHATLGGEAMQATLSRLKGPSLLISDEVHHLGSELGLDSLPEEFAYRLGLSATPDRWFDEEGTAALKNYFGPPVFEFTLDDALKQGFLSKYYYRPCVVELTDDEIMEYRELTKRLAQAMTPGTSLDTNVRAQHLLRERANLLNSARRKLEALRELLGGRSDLRHALFYCVPGQIDSVVSVLGNEFGLRVHKFTYDESMAERRRLLDDFADGRMQALVAIRCLDEGVDVPNTREAFILASSSNPREFIQRRGRILRKAEGKEHAVIHDFIVVPPFANGGLSETDSTFNLERRIIRREFSRFKEFADSAHNKFEANNAIWDIAQRYNIRDF